ncbi:MAG: hypothetical protein V3V25_09635 [Paracoccaceae bacterium]
MTTELPDYYFRIKENGAFVFRVDTDNRQRRIEMDQIAVLNIKNGDIKAQGDRELSQTDMVAIEEWIAARKSVIAARSQDAIAGTVEHINLTTHWINSKASDTELEAITDELLMAMHDLRTVLVRKKAGRLDKA